MYLGLDGGHTLDLYEIVSTGISRWNNLIVSTQLILGVFSIFISLCARSTLLKARFAPCLIMNLSLIESVSHRSNQSVYIL